MNQRRKFSAAFKTKVVLEALSERHTIQELGRKFEVHPNQIAKWKAQFLASAQEVFSNGKDDKATDLEKEHQKLYEKIGQLQVENDFLKKALS